ncbi:MAG: hypothetical protein B7Z77_06665 [Acidocella sp. 20-58-15]|nr:MAG: hypothetical protein B7Z77_06665 [Acidocella sp. 20-58-15]
MIFSHPWRNAANCMILTFGLLLTGCVQRPPAPPPPVVTAAPPPPAPDPAALHKAFEAGYAAGYASARRIQARLDEQLKPQPANSDTSQSQVSQSLTSEPSVTSIQSNNLAVATPSNDAASSPAVTFQQAGQAIPVSRGN